ncbi:MAG: 3-dehydroquinate synthase [Pseudomonadota bacterium]
MHTPQIPSDVERVVVELGERSYDILIGDALMERVGPLIRDRFGSVRTAIVSDEHVATCHLEALRESLALASIETADIIVPQGESSKSWPILQDVVDKVLHNKLERGDFLIALGGGVIGDLAGFAASLVRRGMPFIQVPTSLLAQVDSSVGGKTGINASHGKNLIGAFHQPHLVVADTTALDTLSARHMRAGYAEVAKYGLIDDAEFFSWLEENVSGVFSGGAARRHAVATSCRAKAKIVAADEREAGVRALLNLGHTFGHALEAATGYSDRLVHGEAIAIGMVLAHRFSARLGLAPEGDAERVRVHFERVGLPFELAHIPGEALNADELMTHIAQDKKVKRGALTFILTRGIGKAFIQDDVSPGDVKTFLEDNLVS